jgi:TPR repeat protein
MESKSKSSSLHWWWLSIILFITLNCKKTNSEKDLNFTKMNDTSVVYKSNIISDTTLSNKDLEEFKLDIINKGDNYSFNRLAIHYTENSNYKELHKYSLIMANKYNKGDGCNQSFIDIVAMNNNNSYRDISDFSKINAKAKSEALKYLEKGILLNDINSASMLEEIYRNGIGIAKDIKKADEIKKKIDKM